MRVLVASLCIALTASFANAAVTSTSVTSAPAITAGFITNQITITFDGQLGGQQLAIDVASGDVLNNAFGSDTAPNGALLPVFPDLADDTYVTIGGVSTLDPNTEATLVVGEAVNIPGSASPAATDFLTGPISIAWAPGTGVAVSDQVDYLIAQITLSETAQGSAFLFSSTVDGAPAFEIAGTVVDGALTFSETVIPEPTSAVLAALAAAGGFIRRR